MSRTNMNLQETRQIVSVPTQRQLVPPVFYAPAYIEVAPPYISTQDGAIVQYVERPLPLLTRMQMRITDLLYGPGWSWAIPIGLALVAFYGRFLVAALLSVSQTGRDLSIWALFGGATGILLGWIASVLLFYAASWLANGRALWLPLLIGCAWARVPLIVRDVVQGSYMLAQGDLLHYPGLSGLVSTLGPPNLLATLGHELLRLLDVYTLFYCLLLALAVRIGGQLSWRKSLAAVACYGLLVAMGSSLVSTT